MNLTNQITKGDSFELIHKVPNKSIDLILTDPPYFLFQGQGISNKSWDSSISLLPTDIQQMFLDNDLSQRERSIILDKATKEYFERMTTLLIPKVKDNGIMIIFNRLHNLKIIEHHLEKDLLPNGNSKWYCTYFEWKKKNPQPLIREKEQSEYALIAFNTSQSSEKLSQLPQFWQDALNTDNQYLFTTPALQKTIYYESAGHVSPKPIELWLSIIRRFSKPNDLILDIFSGTGLTALTSYDLGRNFIAFEFDNEQFENSIERLDFFRKNMPRSLFPFED